MMSERIYLNNDWKFAEQFEASMTEAAYDDSAMQNVRLPHTCKETPLHYFDEHCYQMISGYRRVIEAEKEWEGKKILLTIDGAAHDSEVFLNGEKVGEHHCGYTAFTMDISGALRYGEKNILVVKVDSREDLNIPPFGYVIDYMTYGGIYRDVTVLGVEESHFDLDYYGAPGVHVVPTHARHRRHGGCHGVCDCTGRLHRAFCHHQ